MQYEKFLFFAKHKLGISTLALGIFEISEDDHPWTVNHSYTIELGISTLVPGLLIFIMEIKYQVQVRIVQEGR